MHKEKYLDGLRGLSAFIVVIYHYAVGFYPALYYGSINNIRTHSGIELLIAKTPLNLIYDGDVSVCIFFILSGYVLTYKFFKYNDINGITSTAIRRYFRLMPPVFFSIFLAYILMELRLFYNVQASEITTSDWLKSFYNFEPNALEAFKQGVWGVFFIQSTSYNPTLWTMYYEFYGSFIVLSFVLLIGKNKNRYIFYIVALFATINTKFLPFILGLILSDVYNFKQHSINKFNTRYTNFIILSIGMFLASYPPFMPVENTIYRFIKINFIQNSSYFYHSIGAFFIMIVFLNSVKLKQIFSGEMFVFLGKISFSMYIIHFLVLNSLSSYLFIKLSTFLKYYQAFLIVLLISLGIIIYCSYCVYRYVDLNGIKLSKYLYNKFFRV